MVLTQWTQQFASFLREANSLNLKHLFVLFYNYRLELLPHPTWARPGWGCLWTASCARSLRPACRGHGSRDGARAGRAADARWPRHAAAAAGDTAGLEETVAVSSQKLKLDRKITKLILNKFSPRLRDERVWTACLLFHAGREAQNVLLNGKQMNQWNHQERCKIILNDLI